MQTPDQHKPATISPDELAAINTALALDRTLLSAVRTSLALTGFGFTLAKFVHDLIIKGMLHRVPTAYPRQAGFALMGLGLATLIAGIVEYVRVGRKVSGRGIWTITLAIALCLGAAVVFLIGSLMSELGPGD